MIPAALPQDLQPAGRNAPLLIAAWFYTDPPTAARLLEEWLATADSRHRLFPMCPFICQLAEQIVGVLPKAEVFLQRILPHLAQYVDAAMEEYDPDGRGLPVWPSPEEALFPGEFAPGRVTVDLMVLLSNEIAAFERLSGKNTSREVAHTLDMAEGERNELDEWLRQTFWNEEEGTFGRYEAGKEMEPDPSPCGYFPLVWSGQSREMGEALRPAAARWRTMEWTPRGWCLFFFLLLHTSHKSILAQMLHQGLPVGALPLEMAAWTVLACAAGEKRPALPGLLHWLDSCRHVRMYAWLAAALLAVFGLVWAGMWLRSCRRTVDIGQLEYEARALCEAEEHEQAAELFRMARLEGHEDYFAYRQAGEWMHAGQYARAEGVYREMLARAPDEPNVPLNLALAVLKQDRRPEAMEMYRRFSEDQQMRTRWPELADRARLAVELLEQQQRLDARRE
ncbi:MAG: tetratricopeptide repeat protein [Verrucomicrobiota bacterium]|jgi:tetratricopeptide (TPR) repeat protein|nr:tetratricopeptide repeat protein [Verrucomicrobiota bacterium]